MGNQTTPLAVDQYSRAMVEAFDDRQIIGVPTVFQAFFGRPETGGMTLFSPNANLVEIDILRGNERLAAMIHRGTNSRTVAGQKNTNEQKFSSISRKYPLLEEEGDINADQLNFRMANENPYVQKTKLDRLRMLGLNHHMEHVRRMARTFEYLAAQSIIDGTMPAIIGTTNTDLLYDFYRLATHIVTVGTAWDASGDILGDIDGGCDLIRQDGHVMPDMIIFGKDVVDPFIKDTTVAAVADNRRFELIEVSTNNPVPAKYARFVESGAIPRGRLRTPAGYELWMFSYIDSYDNASGTTTPYLPVDQAVLAYSGARCDRYFGPSEVLPMTPQRSAWYNDIFGFNPMAVPMPPKIKGAGDIIRPEMFYFDAYAGENHKTLTIRSQAAPIFATTQTDAFVTLKGLLT